jgi:hypothetical protein
MSPLLRLLPLLFLPLLAARSEEPLWKAAATKVLITPTEPMWMSGYAARNHPAEGTAQDLFAKALAIEDAQGARIVFITLDLIGVPRALRDHLAARLGEKHHLPSGSLLINASHTHCGPEFRIGAAAGDFSDPARAGLAESYGAALEEKLFTLASDALAQLAPAQISYRHSRCGFSMNRRLPVEGGYQNSPNPDGPVDQDVPVLRVTDAGGKVRAILFGYACHNTTLPFYRWCGDYAGYAQEYLEADTPGAVALFVQGCAGDQNPYPRGRIELAQFHGRALATSVEAALSATSQPLHGPLSATESDVDLDFAPQPPREAFEAQLTSKDKALAAHAQRMIYRIDHEGKLPEHYAYPVQLVRFGKDLTLVALGGETVVDYSLRLKRELKGSPVWVAGYSNDVMAYIPSKRVLEEGGYEGGDSMKWGNLPFPWAPTTEERIVAKVHELRGE